jgi:hypothetical protein
MIYWPDKEIAAEIETDIYGEIFNRGNFVGKITVPLEFCKLDNGKVVARGIASYYPFAIYP